MIPPSIVLIIYGLITETSIKALFTGAFIPGFMLASFIIIYIVVRTQLNPSMAPLPERKPGDPTGLQKLGMFGGFLSIVLAGFATLLFLRALYYTVSGLNAQRRPHCRSDRANEIKQEEHGDHGAIVKLPGGVRCIGGQESLAQDPAGWW